MPQPTAFPSPIRGSVSKVRSSAARAKRQIQLWEKRLARLMKEVTTIRVPFTLEDMTQDMFKAKSLDDICKDLEDYQHSQCFSAKFVDANEQTILFYFGLHHNKESRVGSFVLN